MRDYPFLDLGTELVGGSEEGVEDAMFLASRIYYYRVRCGEQFLEEIISNFDGEIEESGY